MKSFEGLSTGDVVRHKNGSDGYIVTANYGDRVTAVRTIEMSNPPEWDLEFKANLEKPAPEVKEECSNCGYHRPLKPNDKSAFSEPSNIVRCILPNNQYAEATYKCPMWYLESEKVKICFNCGHFMYCGSPSNTHICTQWVAKE